MTGNMVCSSRAVRNAIGLRCGRGALIALCEGAGLYQSDIDRAEAESDDRNPDAEDGEAEPEKKGRSFFTNLAANLEIEEMARHESAASNVIQRQFDLTRFQFSPQAWLTALRSNELSERSLRCVISKNQGTRSWIEGKIRAGLTVQPEECVTFYKAHQDVYAQPLRIRASHIFFAAPPGSSPELIEQKRVAAQAICDRLGQGEKFADLAITSEDEASRKRGGDLNFFAESRIPADFWAAINPRRTGDAPWLIQTKLGFHVVQVTAVRPSRAMPFEEARPAIVARLENEKRSALIASLTEELGQRIRWNRAE